MENYQTLAQFAGTFGLVFMVLVFAFAVFWTMRPSARKGQAEAANIPFRNENNPAKAATKDA